MAGEPEAFAFRSFASASDQGSVRTASWCRPRRSSNVERAEGVRRSVPTHFAGHPWRASDPLAQARSVPLKHEPLQPLASQRAALASSRPLSDCTALLCGAPTQLPTECIPAARSARSTQFHHPVQRIRCIQMGRRGRQREHRRETAGREARDRMARVQVSDETWSTVRAGLGSTPASVALGRLVEREVASRRRRSASDSGSVSQAVEDARVVVDELRR
jgi:hypothetical protein